MNKANLRQRVPTNNTEKIVNGMRASTHKCKTRSLYHFAAANVDTHKES